MISSGGDPSHPAQYPRFQRSRPDRSPGGSGDSWPRLVLKLDFRLTAILCLQLNLFSASFPGEQPVVSSGLSVREGVLTGDGPRKSPVSGRFDFLHLSSLICRFVAL